MERMKNTGNKEKRMKLLHYALLSLALAMPFTVKAVEYSRDEWKVRPWEIIQGLQPRSAPLWQLDRDSIVNWKAEGAESRLSTTNITKLWGENVVRLDFKRGAAKVTPAAPILIQSPVDGIELWVYGPSGGGIGDGALLSFLIADADGKKRRINADGFGSRWARQRWWGTSAAVLPQNLKYPVKIESFTFKNLSEKMPNDFLCFDHLGTFSMGRPEGELDHTKLDLPFPNTPDGILPILLRSGWSNSVKQQADGAVVFSCQYPQRKDLSYVYRPATGTLGDITVEYEGKSFRPAVKGGPHAALGTVRFAPGDAEIQTRLLSKAMSGSTLKTVWEWSKGQAKVTFGLDFRVKGLTLEVVASSDSNDITAFDAGETENTPKPMLFGMTYLNNRWNYPRILATPEYFVSVFADWYYSQGSSLVEGANDGVLRGAKVISDTSARILGGVLYGKKTDGRRNRLYERFYYTVSPELEDVLPDIPNPPSTFIDETKKLVCMTRAYSVQRAEDVQHELDFWQKMKDYGVEDMFVRFHSGQYRTPKENNHTTLSMDGAMSEGGDATILRLCEGMRKIVKRAGPYNDNRIIASNSMQFKYNLVSRTSNGGFVLGWDGCFRPKPTVQLKLMKDFIPGFLKKYPWNAEYLDELTNAPPWADVDFDAASPGAGTFSSVLLNYGAVALQQKKMYNGPIWSEGCAAYFWAGLTDVDYAVSNDTNAGLPLLVDFKLRKINPVSSYTGADWPILHNRDYDKIIASEIACGNIGHLAFRCGTAKNQLPQQGQISQFSADGWNPLLKSYFMIRQIQELYGKGPVAEIRYAVDDKMLTASEMLRGGSTGENKVYIRYANGLEVWVNRNGEANWSIDVDGEEILLPPNGHYARMADQFLQYTMLVDERRVDYSSGKLYTYVNAHGTAYQFPEITAEGAFLLRPRDGGTQLIPLPYEKQETVKGLCATSATPLTQTGKPAGDTKQLDVTDGGRADLLIDGKAFSYLLK